MRGFQQVWGLTVFLEGRDGVVGGAASRSQLRPAAAKRRLQSATRGHTPWRLTG